MAEKCPRKIARCSPGPSAAEAPTDGELLRRFASDRDDAAFAGLVERHGPLVLGVCRRVLGTVQDAEDAFQATFLVLARKAGAIRDPGLLGNWLYGVASRVARKARVALDRRRRHERRARFLPHFAAPAAVELDDLRPLLEQELRRLPERHRAAVGLCYLEGKSNAEAARLLRCPTGTVKGRLARARQLLRHRLIGRGLGAFVLLLAGVLAAAPARAGVTPFPPAAPRSFSA
jgi:RNA polymerase sigma-70 factor (ECF subfamily)